MPKIVDPADGLVADIVGRWAMEKHERLKRYIDAARAARAKFLPPRGSGGASYIDLFSGPGRSFIEETGQFIDGSPLVAYKIARRSKTRFSELHFNDLDPENSAALMHRINALGGSGGSYCKSAEVVVDEIIDAVKIRRIHFAFLDPYNLESLPFSIIRRLASLPRMDMLIHVSVFDLQRNLRRYISDGQVLDAFMPGWRDAIDTNQTDERVRASLLAYWLAKIKAIGATPADGIELVSATGGQRLYWLVFVSSHDLALRLWDDIRNVGSQTRLFD